MSTTWVINAALAVPFAVEATTFDFVVDATTRTASVAAGTYRVNLATSGYDILRELRSAMLGATPSLPGDVTIEVEISGETGLVEITCSVPISLTDLHTTPLGRALGFTISEPADLVQSASRQPWYLALFCGARGGIWTPRRSGARERDAAGRVYSFAGTLTTWDREVTSDLIPWGPTEAAEAECPATPMYPLSQYREVLGVTSTSRVWSLLDVWTSAQNAGASIGCALALNWQTVRASTSERYDIGSLASDILDPTRLDERWQRYVSAKWGFVLPASGQTGTRA